MPGDASLARLYREYGQRREFERVEHGTEWVACRRVGNCIEIIGGRDLGALRYRLEQAEREDGHESQAPMTGTPPACPPPAGPDAYHPLRRLRRRRGMTLAALAGLTGVSTSYISMVERGERTLTRLNHINAIAAALRVSPAELAPDAIPAHPSLQPAAAPALASAFPALRDEATMTRHARLVSEFLTLVARGDSRAAGIWLRRAARDPAVSPWLLLDLIATGRPGRPRP